MDPSQMHLPASPGTKEDSEIAITVADVEVERVNSSDGDGEIQAAASIFDACKQGDADAIRGFLDGNVRVDAVDRYGMTPLLLACKHGHADVMQLLLENGANANFTTQRGVTPLFVAIAKKCPDLVTLLLDYHADPRLKTDLGVTSLHLASEFDAVKSMQVLLDWGVEADILDVKGRTSLYITSQKGSENAVQLLLNAGADVNFAAEGGETSLFAAAQGGHVVIVIMLMRYGSRVDSTTVQDVTPLRAASQIGHLDVVRMLLKHGANTDSVADDNVTPLFAASRKGHAGIVEELVKNGADVNYLVSHWDAATALCIASANGHTKVVKYLISVGATVDLSPRSNATPLFFACGNGHVDVVTILIAANANVNQVGVWEEIDDQTPLSIASRCGYVDIMKTLLANGANADIILPLGSEFMTLLHHASIYAPKEAVELLLESALHLAAAEGRTDVVRLLSKAGAAVDLVDDDASTSLWIASCHGQVEVVEMLLDAGAGVDLTANDNGTALKIFEFRDTPLKLDNGAAALYIASRHGHTSVVQLLLARGANVDQAKANGMTPLSIASQNGHIEVVNALLLRNAKTNVQDVKGKTALFYASRNGHLEVVRTLLDHQASPSLSSVGGKTPLLVAGSHRHFDIFNLLIESGASVHIRAPDGETPLTLAASRDEFGAIARLADQAFLVLHASSGVEKSLLPTTLEVLRESGSQLCEFRSIWDGAVNRLFDAYDGLVREVNSAQRFKEYVMIIARLSKLKTKCLSKDVFSRLVAARKIVSGIEDFHVEINKFVRCEPSNEPDDEQVAWENEKKMILEAFRESVSAALKLVNASEENHTKAAMTLQNELVSREDQWSPDFRSVLKEALEMLSESVDYIAHTNFPRWFISPDELDLGEMNIGKLVRDKFSWDGKWLDSRVTIYQVKAPVQVFIGEVEKWLPLSHPNIVRIFGASHLDGSVQKGTWRHPHRAILEDVSFTSLRYYLAKHLDLVWQKLHEAALGVKYVHERGIVLGTLSCASIWIGTNGVAKIAGFGASIDKVGDVKHIRWAAPERLKGDPPTFESDMFSFGMCILEALTRAKPWGKEESNEDVKSRVIRGGKPHYPVSLNDSQRHLLDKMLLYDPARRMAIAEAAEHLKTFANQEMMQNKATDGSSEGSEFNLETKQVDGCTIAQFLEYLKPRCESCHHLRTSVLHIYKRLVDVYERLHEAESSLCQLGTEQLCNVLERLDVLLRVTRSEMSVFDRDITIKDNVLHQEIDKILRILRIAKPKPIHIWKKQSEYQDATKDEDNVEKKGLTPVAESPIKIVQLNSENPNPKYKRIELVDRTSNQQQSVGHPWLISHNQLVLDVQGDKIGSGSFGDVYKATWLGTPVVVKYMGYEGRIGKDEKSIPQEHILHEIRIWYPLNHPHVIKLFGASHVGKRYFVCEYAPNGTLEEYFKEGKHRDKVWQKLHEAALGLQYLHEENILHNDLKCDNFLIGEDGRVKVADFGLSCIPGSVEVKVDQKNQGAVHWKSPEYLRGERLTLAADIYGFGMCVLQAITGDIPWGKAMSAGVVKYHVKKGEIPHRPDTMGDAHWHLVEMMCHKDVTKRVKIGYVVQRLQEFSQLEAITNQQQQFADGPMAP